MNEILDNPAQKIWQDQPVKDIQMSIDVLRNRADKFERRVIRRNIREYISSLLAAGVFVYFFATTQAILFRLAYALFIAGLAWVVLQLHRKGAVKTMPATMGTSTSLQFFRTQLERQRDAVQSIWSWYLAPLVPGFLLLTVGTIVARPNRHGLASAASMDVFVVALFFVVWKINVRAARCLQRTIDELSAAEK